MGPRDSRASVAASQSPPLRGGFNRPYSASTKSDDSVQQLFGGAQPPAVLGNDRQATLECLGGEPSQMRRDDDILELEQSIVCADELAGKYIKTGTRFAMRHPPLQRWHRLDDLLDLVEDRRCHWQPTVDERVKESDLLGWRDLV